MNDNEVLNLDQLSERWGLTRRSTEAKARRWGLTRYVRQSDKRATYYRLVDVIDKENEVTPA